MWYEVWSQTWTISEHPLYLTMQVWNKNSVIRSFLREVMMRLMILVEYNFLSNSNRWGSILTQSTCADVAITSWNSFYCVIKKVIKPGSAWNWLKVPKQCFLYLKPVTKLKEKDVCLGMDDKLCCGAHSSVNSPCPSPSPSHSPSISPWTSSLSGHCT